MSEQESRNWGRIAIIAVLALAAYNFGIQILSALSGFLMLLLLGWLISIAIEPPVHWFERHGYRRGLGAGVVLLGLVLAGVGFGVVFGSLMVSQLTLAIESAPAIVSTLVGWLNERFNTGIDPAHVLDSLNIDTARITQLVTELAGGLVGVLGGVFTALFDFFTVLMLAFYMSADAHKIKRAVASWLPPDQQKIFVNVWDIAVKKAGGFVVSRVVLASASAFAHSVFFMMIGIPYWLPMGILAGLTSQFVPNIGTYLGILIPALFAVTIEPLDVVWIIVFATIYQQIENYVLGPRISRATMDMHPAIAFGAVIVGAIIFGPIGALIGIPIIAAVLAVADTYGHRHELIADLNTDIEPAAD